MKVNELFKILEKFEGSKDEIVIIDREGAVDTIADVCIRMGSPSLIMLSVKEFNEDDPML